MEPENIGIADMVKAVHDNPKAHSTIIGRRAARIAMRRISQSKHARPLDDTEILATAGGTITPLQVESYARLTEMVIAEHANKSKDGSVHEKVRSAVAQACMELLGDTLHRRWYVDLAHYIHNSPNTEIILSQPHRLCILEHGIIPLNRVYDYDNKDVQFWTGHDTEIGKYTGSNSTHIPNLLMILTKNDNWWMSLSVKLKGERITTFSGTTVVRRRGGVDIYSDPVFTWKEWYDLHPIISFETPFERFQEMELTSNHTWWHLHKVRGTIAPWEDESLRSQNTTENLTLCINIKNPALSFMKTGEKWLLNNYPYMIDSEESEIILFTQDGTKKIPYKEIGSLIKEPNGEEYIPFSTDEGEKRLVYKNWGLQIANVK